MKTRRWGSYIVILLWLVGNHSHCNCRIFFFWKFFVESNIKRLFMFSILSIPIVNVLGEPWVDNRMGVLFFANILEFITWTASHSFTSILRIVELSVPPLALRGVLDFTSWHVILDYKGSTRLYMGQQSCPKT